MVVAASSSWKNRLLIILVLLDRNEVAGGRVELMFAENVDDVVVQLAIYGKEALGLAGVAVDFVAGVEVFQGGDEHEGCWVFQQHGTAGRGFKQILFDGFAGHDVSEGEVAVDDTALTMTQGGGVVDGVLRKDGVVGHGDDVALDVLQAGDEGIFLDDHTFALVNANVVADDERTHVGDDNARYEVAYRRGAA